MASEPPRATIAAPNFPLFVIVYAGCMTAFTVWMALQLLGQSTPVKGALFLLLTPIGLLIAAPWVGRSPNLLTLIGRSVAVHALAPLVPVYLMAAARADDPGASAHGGMFLVVIYLFPIAIVAGAILGLVGALGAFGAMKLVRTR